MLSHPHPPHKPAAALLTQTRPLVPSRASITNADSHAVLCSKQDILNKGRLVCTGTSARVSGPGEGECFLEASVTRRDLAFQKILTGRVLSKVSRQTRKLAG
jgi:hypothetical protein